MNQTLKIASFVLAMLFVLPLGACSTAPEGATDRDMLLSDARTIKYWFTRHVAGLDAQIDDSAGYIVFPDVAQWGVVFFGGTWSRGAVMDSNDDFLGWASIKEGSVGLQAGVQGFRMLFVLEDKATLDDFKASKWTGSVSAMAVAAEAGGSSIDSFTEGVAAYQGANHGLMAGVRIGLEYVRFEYDHQTQTLASARTYDGAR